MSNKIIRVTLADIRQGIAADCQKCPVAIAVKRAFDADWVEVDHYSARWWIDGTVYSCSLPQKVATWIANFDAHVHVLPFFFKMISVDFVL